jgi:hypothetical protein
LLDILLADNEVSSQISTKELAKLCDSMRHMRCAQQMVDDVLRQNIGGQSCTKDTTIEKRHSRQSSLRIPKPPPRIIRLAKSCG